MHGPAERWGRRFTRSGEDSVGAVRSEAGGSESITRRATGAVASAAVERAAVLAAMIRDNIGRVIVGKDAVVELVLVALLSEGHILLEDVPGLGKTVLAKSVARSIGCSFKRIQFTPDLIPSDVTGINFFNQRSGEFEFRAGPISAQIVLADEINRATPRTQSALLEAMEERQLTVEGVTMRAALAVPGHRHAESDRAGGDVSLAGGATRPLPAAAETRLSQRSRGAGDPGPL